MLAPDYGTLFAGCRDLKIVVTFQFKGKFEFLEMIIDSYSKTDNKGLPMGNQTSQWFALYYLDSFDRLAKEKLHFKYSNAGEMKNVP